MKNPKPIELALLLSLALPGFVYPYTILKTDGTRIEAIAAPEIKGSQVLFRVPQRPGHGSGASLCSIPIARYDEAATLAANQPKVPKDASLPQAQLPEPQGPVPVITNDSILTPEQKQQQRFDREEALERQQEALERQQQEALDRQQEAVRLANHSLLNGLLWSGVTEARAQELLHQNKFLVDHLKESWEMYQDLMGVRGSLALGPMKQHELELLGTIGTLEKWDKSRWEIQGERIRNHTEAETWLYMHGVDLP